MGRWSILALLAGIAVVAVAGYAIGAGKPSKDLVLCATKKSGDLSLASAKGKCAKGEKKLTVAKEGPVGPVGPPGASGAAANATLEAVHYVTEPFSTQCNTQPGTFCTGLYEGSGWSNLTKSGAGDEWAGFFKEADGTVHLVGSVAFSETSGGEHNDFIAPGPFFLPPGYRPGRERSFKVPSGAALAGSTTVKIRTDGAVAMGEVSAALDGISFRTP